MPDRADCLVSVQQIIPCLENLRRFAQRYMPFLGRREHHGHALTYLEGLVSDLPRRTIEPIAVEHDQDERGLQRFVGQGAFDDDVLIAELQRHVGEEIGDPAGVMILDGTCFEKKGTESVGVQRQWNGRLGKQDNCQKGILLGYVSPHGSTLVDRRLYLPETWACDPKRRLKCHIPDVPFKKAWEIGLDLLERATVPFAWVVADDEFGRSSDFRAALQQRGKRYAVDVPASTVVQPITPSTPPTVGRPRTRTQLRVSDWARGRKRGAWVRVLVRDGAKGPAYVLATETFVEVKPKGRPALRERLVVIKTTETDPRTWYVLSNAGPDIAISAIVCAHATRHTIEQSIEQAKGEAGLAHYEVRSWVGWHHHMTFSMLATFFLTLERRRFCEEDTDDDGATDRPNPCMPSAKPKSESRAPRATGLAAARSE